MSGHEQAERKSDETSDKEIAAQTGGDLFEIVPAVACPDGYDEMLTAATEKRANNARPEIKSAVADFDSYDTRIPP